MSQPQGVFGLEVPPGGVLIPAVLNFPATIAISMAAIDPTAEPEADEEGNIPTTGRSTLRIVRRPIDDESDDEDEEDEYLRSILAGSDDDDEDDDEPNGGPSDPSKSPRRKDIKALLDALAAENGEDDDDEDEDEEMEDAGVTKGKKKANGAKPTKTSKKGKEPATVEDDEDDEDDDEDDEDDEDDSDDEDVVLEDFVLCTLDTERLYQQPLQIEINAGETVFFTVTGSHAVHLTGNYIVEDDEDSDDEDDEDDEDYDLPPDIDLEELDSEDEDELDELDLLTGRIEEVEDDDEVVPKLAEVKKNGKKRPAEDAAEQTLDDLISKEATKEAKGAETKLTKKQQKKLKNNQGEAVGVQKQDDEKKRVQFAKNLEQGPTGSGAKDAKDAKDTKGKTALGVKVVQGVTIDDRKLGSGRIVKSGDRVGMRYIGKLENGKVFDSNKKGPAFSFRVGKGEVIRGWDIGIAGMAIGGERRLTIPAHLAYGSKKLDGIPANSTLIFDVKLLEIK